MTNVAASLIRAPNDVPHAPHDVSDSAEPIRVAVLAYDPGSDRSPRVVAKGSGEVAQRIIELARKNGLPFHHDPGLVSFLMRIDLEERIPPELYVAVAAVLALVWQADGSAHSEKHGTSVGVAERKPQLTS